MTIREYVFQAYREMRNKPFKEKLEYFWEYFKWEFLIGLLVLALLVQGVVSCATRKEDVFAGVFITALYNAEDHGFLQDYNEYSGIDIKKQEALFYTNVLIKADGSKSDSDSLYGIFAKIINHELDFIAGQPETFEICAYHTSGLLCDLRKYMEEQALAHYAGRLYYIDLAVIEQLETELGDEKPVVEFPDPHKPELMEKPIPVGIDISDLKMFNGRIYKSDVKTYIGIVANTQRPERFLEFLDFLWSAE